MMSKYLDNFHNLNFVIFIVFVDLHWYVYYVNVSLCQCQWGDLPVYFYCKESVY